MNEFNLEEYLKKLEEAKNIDECPKVPIPNIEKDQNYVFVSYSHKDYKQVYYDLAHLYCQGVRFWYDKGLPAGEDWEKEVQDKIKSVCCCGVIFFLSTNMFLSESIFKEIKFTSAKKKPNIILNKNYFCVNLQDSNISDMLFKVQEIQRNEGMQRFDTKKINLITSTFSDNDKYIKFNNSYHIEELIEEIQHKFDVTNSSKSEQEGPLALGSIKDPRLAFFAISEKETDPIPLFKFLYADFKKTKTIRPWYLFIIGIVVGILVVLAGMFAICKIPNLPLISEMNYIYIIFTSILSVLCCLWMVAKVYWLFYISPFGRYREKGILGKIINCVTYFLAILFMGALCIVISTVAIYLYMLLLNYIIKKGS